MEIFAYRTDALASPPIDITRFDVAAIDGYVGTVDEATYADGQGCLVVETGFWIFRKKRMIPAGVVILVDPDERELYVSMTRDQVKRAPPIPSTPS